MNQEYIDQQVASKQLGNGSQLPALADKIRALAEAQAAAEVEAAKKGHGLFSQAIDRRTQLPVDVTGTAQPMVDPYLEQLKMQAQGMVAGRKIGGPAQVPPDVSAWGEAAKNAMLSEAARRVTGATPWMPTGASIKTLPDGTQVYMK